MSDLRPTGLGDSQADVLRTVKRLGEATVGELVTSLGLARETLRDHCRGLAAEGLVERAGVRRRGAGRPQVVYRLTARGEELFPRREGELLAELAGFLLAQGDDHLERFFAERAERRRPAMERRLAGLAGEARLREVAAILSEEGYLAEAAAGEPDAGAELRLCHCPLRDLVAVSRLPCRAEMALVEHLLGTPLTRESFMPDGSPSCTYRLAPRPVPAPAAPGHEAR